MRRALEAQTRLQRARWLRRLGALVRRRAPFRAADGGHGLGLGLRPDRPVTIQFISFNPGHISILTGDTGALERRQPHSTR